MRAVGARRTVAENPMLVRVAARTGVLVAFGRMDLEVAVDWVRRLADRERLHMFSWRTSWNGGYSGRRCIMAVLWGAELVPGWAGATARRLLIASFPILLVLGLTIVMEEGCLSGCISRILNRFERRWHRQMAVKAARLCRTNRRIGQMRYRIPHYILLSW